MCNLCCSLSVPDNNEKHEGDLSAVAVALVIAIPSAVICIMGIIAVLWYNRYHDKKTSTMRHYVNVEVGKDMMASNFEVNNTKKLKDIIDASMSGKYLSTEQKLCTFHFILSVFIRNMRKAK